MPDVSVDKPKGVLRPGWSAEVEDYAIAGGWTQGGKVLVVGDAAGGVYGFKHKSGEPLWEHKGIHKGGVMAIAMRPNTADFATVGQDGRVLIWDTSQGQVAKAIELGKGWVENVAWSRDGNMLAASLSRRVHVYRADGEEAWRTDEHPSTVSAIAWSGSKELATACYGRVKFFDASCGEARQTLQWKGSLVSMALSPNGDIVACGSQDNSVHFWRRSTGQDSMMSGYRGKPSALAFDDTGTLLATGGGEAAIVWSFQGNGPEGTRPGMLELHARPITTLAFARGRRRLASGARDGTVVVWSLKGNGQGDSVGVALLKSVVAGLYWRPDGNALAALDAQGGVTVLRVRK